MSNPCNFQHKITTGPAFLSRTPTSTRIQQIRQSHSTPSALLARTPGNTRIHQCTTARAPQKPCWQELQPALGSMDSPQPQHPISPAGDNSSQHSDPSMQHNQSTPSSLLARIPASTRIHGFTRATAPHHPCWLQPALASMDSPQLAPHHPCRQELQPVLGPMDSTQPQHPISPVGKNSSQHYVPWIHHSHSTPSSLLARTRTSTMFHNSPQPQHPIITSGKNSTQH